MQNNKLEILITKCFLPIGANSGPLNCWPLPKFKWRTLIWRTKKKNWKLKTIYLLKGQPIIPIFLFDTLLILFTFLTLWHKLWLIRRNANIFNVSKPLLKNEFFTWMNLWTEIRRKIVAKHKLDNRHAILLNN